jgi:hypothetical protein
VTGARAVLADAADAAVVPAASASFPGEVAWAAEDSALSVAAVQHLIDAVHSYTGLNWSGFSSFRDLLLLMQFFFVTELQYPLSTMYRGFSIAISTVLLRNMLFMLSIYSRKQFYVRSYIEISAALFFLLQPLSILGQILYTKTCVLRSARLLTHCFVNIRLVIGCK